MGELADIFPDLVLGPSSRDAWILDILDLSFTSWLKMASPGTLRDLHLGTQCLDRQRWRQLAVVGLGLLRRDTLSVINTNTAELPAGPLPILSYRS